jgi:copper chaperone NosL
MALSQPRFASQLITEKGRVYKFDDIRCLDEFKAKNSTETPVVTYFADYDSRSWIIAETAQIVETGISTPMGSGKIAVGDSVRAGELLRQFPPGGSR